MDSEISLFQCILTLGTPAEDTFALHFNQPIPRLEGAWQNGFLGESFGPLSNLPKRRAAIARRLALINRGRIATELLEPGKVFASLIEEFNRIEGLISILNRHPYKLDYKVGFFFDPVGIGERLAKALHQHFFWEQELTYAISQGLQIPKAEADPLTMIHVKAKQPAIDPQ
jgi:hypothetical protein